MDKLNKKTRRVSKKKNRRVSKKKTRKYSKKITRKYSKKKTRKYSKKKTRKYSKKKIKRVSKKKTRRHKKKMIGGNHLQPQLQNYDCVVATISSFTDLPYNQILQENFKDHDFEIEGVKTNDIIIIVKKYIKNVKMIDYPYKNSDVLPENKHAIVGVPSLNYENALHAIYWTGKEIYDPNIGNKNKKLYTTEKIMNNPEIIIDMIVEK